MSVAPIDFKLTVDLPPNLRRFGLYRWKTAAGRVTKWHLIDTDQERNELVAALDANAELPRFHPAIPMLCGCRSRGPVETLIRTWADLTDGPPGGPEDVCRACVIQAAGSMLRQSRCRIVAE